MRRSAAPIEPLTLLTGLGADLPDAEETVLAVHEALEALEPGDAEAHRLAGYLATVRGRARR